MIKRWANGGAVCVLVFAFHNNSQGLPGKPDDNLISVHSRMGKAEYLVEQCKDFDKVNPDGKTVQLRDAPAVMMCFGYISGIVDVGDFDHAVLPNNPSRGWCMPEGVSNSQLAKVIVKYGNDHPEELHLPAVLLVENALIKAFPCA
jgi:Rap1a immunity proteins